MEDQAEQLRALVRERERQAPPPAEHDKPLHGEAASPRGEADSPHGEDSPRGEKALPRIITVSSGKGGVGKTSLAVNMALSYARLGRKVVLMDGDLGLANVNVMFKMAPQWNLYHVLRRQKTLREIIVETEYGISIVPGASGFSRIANLDGAERARFIGQLRGLPADIIIIDTGAGVSSNVMDFIEAADDVIIITTPEPTAITDAYGIIKIIASELEGSARKLRLVVNRAASVIDAKRVADRLIDITGDFLNVRLEFLGFIYDDTAVAQAVIRQRPFMVDSPRGRAAQCIQHLVGRMEKTEVKSPGAIGSFFKRLFK
jgi:flagellar biosynthesis protein FlhG